MTLLFCGYAKGIFFSRKLEKAAYDFIDLRYICTNANLRGGGQSTETTDARASGQRPD